MTAFLWYLAAFLLLPVGWIGYGTVTGGAPPCSGVFDCTTGFLGGVVFGWMYELFAMIVLAPVLLIPLLVTSLVIRAFGRTHDPVKVGRLAASAGVASVVVPALVLYRVHGW